MRDSGASELIGTILLTAIAVVFASGFVLMVFTLPPPSEVSHADIQAFVLPTAPQELVFEHRGGPGIELADLRASVVTTTGTSEFTLAEGITSGTVVVRSSTGAAKAAADSFAPGDQAVYTSGTLVQSTVRAQLTNVGQNALVLSPASIVETADTVAPRFASATSAYTTSTTTLVVNFSEPLGTISAADFAMTGKTLTVALLGNGSSAEFTIAPAFTDTNQVLDLTSVAVPAGTRDRANLLFLGSQTVTAVDRVAPVLSAISSGAPTSTSATITWTSDVAGDSTVSFGPTPALGRAAYDATSTTAHSVGLTQLTPGTVYYYTVATKDASGNNATSATGSFVTTGGGGGGGGDADTLDTLDFTAFGRYASSGTWTSTQTFNAGALRPNNIIEASSGATLSLPTSTTTLAGLGVAQSWTALQTLDGGATIGSGDALTLTPTATGSLPAAAAGILVYDSTVEAFKVANGTTYEIVPYAGEISDADIAADAALSYSKLNLAGSIVNADVSSSAAIAYSKLNLVGGIVNADVSASAAIAKSKISATGTFATTDLPGTVVYTDTSQTITGQKVLVDPRVADGTDNTKRLAFDVSAIPTATTRTVTFPSASGTIVYSGSIANADIAAGAGIVDTKLATISTAGKVSDSALSSNVARLGTAQTWTATQTFNGGTFRLNPSTAPSALQGLLYFDSGTSKLRVSLDGASFVDVATGAGGGGSNVPHHLDFTTVDADVDPGINSTAYVVTLRDVNNTAVSPVGSMTVVVSTSSRDGVILNATTFIQQTSFVISSAQTTATFAYRDNTTTGATVSITASADGVVADTTAVTVNDRGFLPKAGDSISSVHVMVAYGAEQDDSDAMNIGMSILNPTPTARTIQQVSFTASPALGGTFFNTALATGAGSDAEFSCTWGGTNSNTATCNMADFTLPAFGMKQVILTFTSAAAGDDSTVVTGTVTMTGGSASDSVNVRHEATNGEGQVVELFPLSGANKAAGFLGVTAGALTTFNWRVEHITDTISIYLRIRIPPGWTDVNVPANTDFDNNPVAVQRATPDNPGYVILTLGSTTAGANDLSWAFEARPPATRSGVDVFYAEIQTFEASQPPSTSLSAYGVAIT